MFAADGGRILRAWGPSDRPWVLSVEPEGSRWRATSYGPDGPETREAVRALFSLDHPIEEFYRQARGEPVLEGAARKFRGLRLPRDATVYEALFHSILGQQVSVAAANTIKRRVMVACRAVLEADGLVVPRVPTPAELLGLEEAGLRRCGASGAKARSLMALAAGEIRGEWAAGRFATSPTPVAIATLDAAPGVGRWTAENAVLRGLGRPDVFIGGDLGVRAALDAFGGPPRSEPESIARGWAGRHYSGWGSYATLYLWRRWVTEGAPGGRAASVAG